MTVNSVEVGFTIPERVVLIDRQMLKAYADASGDQNPIHQNEEFALSVGLPNVIAHGMLTMALVGKYVTDWSGGTASVKEFGARFIKPVIVPAGEKVVLIDRQMLKAYADASGDQNPIHQNEEFALSVGLPNVIAHGMLTMALVGKYVTDWSGGTASVKEFGARFIKPVIVPAGEKVDLTINGTVTEVNGDQIKVDLVATSAGVKVLGMAKAVVIKK